MPDRLNAVSGQVASQSRKESSEAHSTSMAAWDLTSPVAAGTRIEVKLGVKCREGCNLRDGRVSVFDGTGSEVASGRLGGSPLDGTDALYWARVEFEAPGTEGHTEWTGYYDGGDASHHAASSIRFALTVSRVELRKLTVRVLDSVSKKPLDNAYVRIGPYTIFSDQSGTVNASVPLARYEFVAWKRNYQMFRSAVTVDGAKETTVELNPQPCKYCPDST